MHRVLIAVVVRLPRGPEVVPTHVITQISLQTNIKNGYNTFKKLKHGQTPPKHAVDVTPQSGLVLEFSQV